MFTLAILVLVGYFSIVLSYDFRTLYNSRKVVIFIGRANSAAYTSILTQSVAYAETNHGIFILAALWKLREILANDLKAVAIVEVIAVDDAERLVDDFLSHHYGMVCTPWLLPSGTL